jgi:hypothetical protein
MSFFQKWRTGRENRTCLGVVTSGVRGEGEYDGQTMYSCV